jgi:hypothetical protein
MKKLNEFIKEYYADGNSKTVKSFKPNMIKGKDLIRAINYFCNEEGGENRKGLYLICVDENDKQHPMKFKYNDAGVLVFKENNNDSWFDWKNGIEELKKELQTAGNDIYQFTFFDKKENNYLLEGDFEIELQSDLNNYNIDLFFYKKGKKYIFNDD